MPSGKDALAAIGVGTALDLAEQGDFGPIGTMAAAVVVIFSDLCEVDRSFWKCLPSLPTF